VEAIQISTKISWAGTICSVQPRIRLLRSFDQRSHSYDGYVLGVRGTADDQTSEIRVAIGKAAQAKHQFRVGDQIQGVSVPILDDRYDTASYYKTSGLKILARGPEPTGQAPPWTGVAPALEVYRERGHRRLHPPTFENACSTCIWGCRMPVEMVIDQWNPGKTKHRFETFCYGPKSCPEYKAGATRKVPGRNGMSWEEEDWVDEGATSHREWDE